MSVPMKVTIWVPMKICCLLAAAVCLAPRPAGAVGLDGPATADTRLGVGIGTGWDQVGGHGRDAFLFSELNAHAERRFWDALYVGGAVTSRADVGSYNFALERWRRGSYGLAAQALLGYDGLRFHLSVGSWLYGSRRASGSFRPALLPYGVLRLRVGSLDGWHFNLRLLDGAPFIAEGGGPGLRLQLGAPARGRHRLAGGIYTSVGEKVVGLSVADEVSFGDPADAPSRRSSMRVRFGGMLGTDLDHAGARPELTVFVGVVW